MSQQAGKSRRLWGLAIRVGGSILLLGLLFWLTDVEGLRGALGSLTWPVVLMAVALHGGAQLTSVWRWWVAARALGLEVTGGNLLRLYWLGMFGNLFLPTGFGGDAIKATMLARQTERPGRAALSILVERAAGMQALLLIGFGGALLLPEGILSSRDVWLLTGLLALGVAGLIAVVGLSPWLGKRIPKVQAFAEALRQLRSPMVILVVGGLSLLVQGLGMVKVWMLGQALGLTLPMAFFAAAWAMVVVVTLLPVSLNGLGLREGVLVLLAQRAGMESEPAIALGLAVLGVQACTALPGGLLLFRDDWRKATQDPADKTGEPAEEFDEPSKAPDESAKASDETAKVTPEPEATPEERVDG